MSCCFVIAPLMVMGMAEMLIAVRTASSDLGYTADAKWMSLEREWDQAMRARTAAVAGVADVSLANCEILAEGMARGETLTVRRGDITATFRRDGRGQCTVHLEGAGRSRAELEAAGEELVNRIRQQFAYNRIMKEMESRGFDVVQQEAGADRSIRLTVRRWS